MLTMTPTRSIYQASLSALCRAYELVFTRGVSRLAPVYDLVIRLYVAEVFFRSGWLKVMDWSSTLYLFQNEYHVPILPPTLAAVMGTGGELGLSLLLALGLLGRFAATGLFILNLVAATSFPDISELGLRDHWLWGALLLVTLTHGTGRISLDNWLPCLRSSCHKTGNT